MQVFEPTYLSTHALPHINFYFFVTTDTLHALKKKMTAEPGPSTAALYYLQSNKTICEALPVLQTHT